MNGSLVAWFKLAPFREDECRVRTIHAAKIINIIRHFVMNLLSRESSCKGGFSSERKCYALSSICREKCLGFSYTIAVARRKFPIDF